MRPAFLLLLCVLGGSAFGQLGRTPPPSAANPLLRDQEAVAAGQRRYLQLCTGCHGRGGEGGQGEGHGPNLVNSWEVRRASDARLYSYIRDGVKGTAMPPFPLPDPQIRELAAFVRSLNAPAASVPVPGDASAGEALYYGKGGCSNCHMIRGRGGYLGPDLSDIGAALRLGEIRDAILNPKALSIDGYRPVVLPGGLRAVIKHSSGWSMQILDERGALHLLRGPDMTAARLEAKGWMPDDYSRRLSETEVRDLLAFLSRQSLRPVSFGDAAPRRRNPEPVN